MEKLGQISESREVIGKEEIKKRIEQFYREFSSKKELGFINDLKNINPQTGVYFVGGAVRDVILGKEPNDIDLIISGIDPSDLIRSLSQYGKLRFSGGAGYNEKDDDKELMEKTYGVIKFKPENNESGEYIDIAYPRQDDYTESGKIGIRGIKKDVKTIVDHNMDIEDDLKRRDFTINAMAIDLFTGKLIDTFGGLDDLLNNKLKTVGDAHRRIEKEDMSRGFRAMRFAAQKGVELDHDIVEALRNIAKPAEKSVDEVFQDEEKLKKAKVYENKVRKLFKISEGENMPVFLQTVWNEENNKPQTAISRDNIEKEVIKALDADPVRFLEVLQNTGMLNILLPEIGELKSEDVEGLRNKFLGMETGGDIDIKLANLFYGLGKINFRNIQDISLRFNFSKDLSRNLVCLLGRSGKFFEELEGIGGEDLRNMFVKDKFMGKKLVKLINLNLGSLSAENQKKAQKILSLVERLFNKKDRKSNISGKKLGEMGYGSGPKIRELMNLLRNMEDKGKKIDDDTIRRMAREINLR